MAENFALDMVEDEELEGIMQLVGFEIGREQFGVNILAVQEIIRSAPVTNVPNSPMFVEGVINLRGDIVPVIDLRKRLNLLKDDMEMDHSKNWVLILNIGDRVIGFIVDSVTEVLKIEEESIEPPPDIIIAGLENQYIQGVCNINDGLLIILEFDRVLFNEEYSALQDTDFEEVSLAEEAIV
jgi:purine-binding chemotaxis protein CheW